MSRLKCTLNWFIAAATLVVLSGCTTLHPAERDFQAIAPMDGYKLYTPTDKIPDQWWESFQSPELNALIETAISDNFTVKEAIARIDQSVAIARQNRSVLLPEIGYDGDASLAERRQDGETVSSESYSAGFSGGVELDIWGRLKANVQVADLDVATIKEDLYAAKQLVAGEVALTWLELQLIQQTLSITREQLTANETVRELIETRFRNGLATVLDVYQQRQVVTQTEAVLPPLEAQDEVLLNQLAVLLGERPSAEYDLGETGFPKVEGLPVQGIPSNLLSRRPDIRAAGLQLRAADWEVTAARADRLPRLNLSGAFSFQGEDVDLLFDSWIRSLAASVTGPIFDAGGRKAEVERTRAVVEERLNTYQRVVVTAMAEVENALVRFDRQQAYIELLQKQYEAESATLREANNRYRNGLNDYLPVLAALTGTQQLEREIIGANHDLLVFRVQLHLAIGGDWMRSQDVTAQVAEAD